MNVLMRTHVPGGTAVVVTVTEQLPPLKVNHAFGQVPWLAHTSVTFCVVGVPHWLVHWERSRVKVCARATPGAARASSAVTATGKRARFMEDLLRRRTGVRRKWEPFLRRGRARPRGGRAAAV